MRLFDPLDHYSYPSLYYNSPIFLLGCREQKCSWYSRHENIKVSWNGRMMPSVLASISFLMMLNIFAASAHSVDSFRELSIVTPRSSSWVVTTALVAHVNSTLCMVGVHRAIHRAASDPNSKTRTEWLYKWSLSYFGYDGVLNLRCSVAMLLMSAWKTVWGCLAAGIQMVVVLQLTNTVICMLDWHFLSLYSAQS